MRKFPLLLVGALVMAAAVSASAMTVDELIAKNLEATGGLEAMQAVKSQKMTGIFQTQGMEIPFTLTQKRPAQLLIEAEFQGMAIKQAYDDGDGWQINPMLGSMDAQDLSPMELKGFKFQADMDGLLIGHEEKGYTLEYIGEDEVEGTPVHHLHVDTHDDATFDIYFDAEYFLVIKQSSTMTIEENEMSSDTYLSDFKEVGSLMIPHSIETRMGEHGGNTILVDTVEFDVDVNDDAFNRPPPAPKKETVAEDS